jgi:hypothetical protein
MSFLIYFFVLLVSAASVLFGLDLVTAPLPKTPNVPIGRSVQMAAQPSQQQRKKEADERALTPVHPAAPGSPKETQRTAQTAGQDTNSASQQQTWMPPPESDQSSQVTAAQRSDDKITAEQTTPAQAAAPAPPAAPTPSAASVAQAPAPARAAPQEGQEATAEPAATTQQPAAQQVSSACNVQACGARYQSFRASDCTYQPVAGDRRACTISTNATTATAQPRAPRQLARQASSRDELSEVDRIVRHQPMPLEPDRRASARPDTVGGGAMSETERIVRRMTRDSETDIPVQGPDGQIIIVRKSYR